KIDYAGVTVAAGERGHIVDVRFGRHGLHCGGDIVIDELMPDVSVKDRSQVDFLHFLRLLHFLCFLHQSLPVRIQFCRIISAFLPRSAGTVCLKFVWVIVSPAAHLPPFAERALWNMSRSRHPSGFAPENLITLAHFSVSSTMSLLKSEGEPANTVPPRS